VEVPESVKIGLANIRPTLHARWNPTGRQTGGFSFDVNGNPRQKTYDPRWELWDTDEFGNTYKITTLEGMNNEYLPLGEWVVEYMQLINPARYDGDLHKMIEALVDSKNEAVEKIHKDVFDHIAEYFADRQWSEEHKGSRIVVPNHMN